MIGLPAIHEDHGLQPIADFKMSDDKEPQPEDDFLTARLVRKVIVLHQRGAEWWAGHEARQHLGEKAEALIDHFDIRVKDFTRLPVPLFRIEPLNCKTVGRYNPNPDGYALVGSISFNLKRLPMDDCLLLAHLLKFLVCFYRHWMGGDGDFDKQAKDMLSEFGVTIDAKGNVSVNRIKKFADFLTSEGITVPDEPVKMPPSKKGKSTLKLWSCHCQGCQVGTQEFFANCPKCGFAFKIGNHIVRQPKGIRAPGTILAERRED